MARHFKEEGSEGGLPSNDGSLSGKGSGQIGVNDLASIGRDHDDDIVPAEQPSGDPSDVFGLYAKHHAGKSGRSSSTRSRRSRRSSRRRHHHHHHHHRRRVWPKVVAVILIVLVVLGIAAGVEGFLLYKSVSKVKAESRIAMDGANEYLAAAKAGDQQALASSAQKISDSAHRLKDDLNETPWTVASMAPVVGSDVTSVRTLANELATIADEALIPLSQRSELMSLSRLMDNGRVNVEALRNITTLLKETSPVITKSAANIESLPKAHIKQVSDILETIRTALAGADDLVTDASPLLDDLPVLLGEGGQEKTYLIVASNNGELHAAGGFVGTLGVITAKDGVLEMGEFRNLNDCLPANDTVKAGATSEEVQIFGARADTHHGDHNVIPDFSRVGQLYFNIWSIAQNQRVDGVIGVDPVFLQRMLALTGGVETSFGVTVDGTNAAAYILNECLFWWEPQVCDEFYKEVARESFNKLLSSLGSVDTLQFMQVVTESATEGRCDAWVGDEKIENDLKQAGFAWELPHDPSAPLTGMFMSDNSATKSAYYLSMDPEVQETSANADGSKTYHVKATVRYNMDRSLANSQLPDYLKTYFGTHTVDARSEVELFEEMTFIAPEGGRIENLTSMSFGATNGSFPVALSEFTYQGLQTFHGAMRIDAGETFVFDYDVVTAPGATEPLRVRVTPLVPHEVRGD